VTPCRTAPDYAQGPEEQSCTHEVLLLACLWASADMAVYMTGCAGVLNMPAAAAKAASGKHGKRRGGSAHLGVQQAEHLADTAHEHQLCTCLMVPLHQRGYGFGCGLTP